MLYILGILEVRCQSVCGQQSSHDMLLSTSNNFCFAIGGAFGRNDDTQDYSNFVPWVISGNEQTIHTDTVYIYDPSYSRNSFDNMAH